MNDVIQVRNKIVNLVFLWPATMGEINRDGHPNLDPKLRLGFLNLPGAARLSGFREPGPPQKVGFLVRFFENI